MSAGLSPVVHPNEAFAGLAARHPEIRLVDFAEPSAAADAVRRSFAALGSAPADLSPYAWRGVAARYAEVYRHVIGRRTRPAEVAAFRLRSEAS